LAARGQGSKWIKDLESTTPLAEAAALIVAQRLNVVPGSLEIAARSTEDPEHVHELRVATRRADAALVAFRPCFKGSRWKRVRKQLRRIRSAASEARTCDVHAMMLAPRLDGAEPVQRRAVEDAIARLGRDRRVAQIHIDEVADRYLPRRLRRSIAKLIDSTRWPKPGSSLGGDAARGANPGAAAPTLRTAAAIELPALLDRVYATAEADLSSLENLHELRLAAKKLRYAMEIFAPCFQKSYRTLLYPPVKALQDRLGRINDVHEIAIRLSRFAQEAENEGGGCNGEKGHDGLRRLARGFRHERDALVDDFASAWEDFTTRCVAKQIGQLLAGAQSQPGSVA
jgi:CHAD domain-containing protein